MAITARELLAKKDLILARKGKQINIDVEGVGVFLANIPEAADFEDAEVYYNAHKREARNSDVVLIYRQIAEPNLKDPDLVAGLAEATGHENAPGPWVVDALLLPGQIARIARIFMEKAGFSVDSARELTASEVKELERQMLSVEAYNLGGEVKNG